MILPKRQLSKNTTTLYFRLFTTPFKQGGVIKLLSFLNADWFQHTTIRQTPEFYCSCCYYELKSCLKGVFKMY